MGRDRLLDLGHVRPTRAHRSTESAASFLDSEEERNAEASPEEPHECSAGLDLSAPLLSVSGTKADPVVWKVGVSEVATIWCPKLGSEDNAIDKGEENSQAIKGEENNGDAQARDDGRSNAIQECDPREGGDKHGEIDGGHRSVHITGNDVTNKGSDE